jgi:uncharacterized protein YndB with AHSA1/START domain
MSDERKIGDEAVRAATGRGWDEWLKLLDRWGAAEKGHKATAEHLQKKHALNAWWAQTVTVRHEKERGLREKHERPGGYEISVTRTIAAPTTRVWEAWSSAKELNRWFTSKARVNFKVGGRFANADGDEGEYRVIVPKKRLRFTWDNAKHCPGTMVEVRLTSKRPKTQVVVQHSKLPDRKGAEDMKEGWSWAMDSLRAYLETGKPVTWEAWREAKKAKSK